MSEADTTAELTIDDRITSVRQRIVSASKAMLITMIAILISISTLVVILGYFTMAFGLCFLLPTIVFVALLYFCVGMFIDANLEHRELLAEKYSKN